MNKIKRWMADIPCIVRPYCQAITPSIPGKIETVTVPPVPGPAITAPRSRECHAVTAFCLERVAYHPALVAGRIGLWMSVAPSRRPQDVHRAGWPTTAADRVVAHMKR
jgi:hypothetical protein